MIDLAKLRKAHAKLKHRIDLAIAEELDTAGQFAKTHVRNHPKGYKHRTGRLIQRTTYKTIKTRSGRILRVKNTAPYARALDGGSGKYGPKGRPYVIRPKRGRALRFTGSDGRQVVTRKVLHPGIKPTRFLWRATHAAYRVAQPNIEQRIRRAIRRL